LQNNELIVERDRLRSNMRDLAKGRYILIKEKQIYAKQMNQNYNSLDKNFQEVVAAHEQLKEEYE